MHRMTRAALAAASLACGAPVAADGGWLQPDWNLRLRHEQVREDVFAEHATAATARLRAGLKATLAPALTGYADIELVTAAGEGYNSGANGRSGVPAILDPEGAELNQAWLQWRGRHWSATGGRQRILFDNQRWVGNVGWRQNEQTFDALAASWQPLAGIELRHAWLQRVHRVAGDRARDPLARERRLDTHLLHATWTRGRSRLSAYGYLHADRDVATHSSATWGVRHGWAPTAGETGIGLTLEAARQSDHGDNPLAFAHRYWLVEPLLATRTASWRAGWEHLGGDGTHAVQAPLATLHAFNGWADRFLVTPPGGLDDRYLSTVLPLHVGSHAIELAVALHDYRSGVAPPGARDLGRELDVSLSLALGPQLRLLAKAADYRAGDTGGDARKLWLQLEWTSAQRR